LSLATPDRAVQANFGDDIGRLGPAGWLKKQSPGIIGVIQPLDAPLATRIKYVDRIPTKRACARFIHCQSGDKAMRKLFALLCVTAILAGVIGCGGDKTTPPADKTPPATPPADPGK
jgi:hypothetical protein